jgi:hypothetical protein
MRTLAFRFERWSEWPGSVPEKEREGVSPIPRVSTVSGRPITALDRRQIPHNSPHNTAKHQNSPFCFRSQANSDISVMADILGPPTLSPKIRIICECSDVFIRQVNCFRFCQDNLDIIRRRQRRRPHQHWQQQH